MPLHDIDFLAALPALASWEGLSAANRLRWIGHDPTEPYPATVFGRQTQRMEAAGLIAPHAGGAWRLGVAGRPLHRALRGMAACTVLEEEGPQALSRWIRHAFSEEEQHALLGNEEPYASPVEALVQRVGSRAWIDGLRKARNPRAWEAPRLAPTSPHGVPAEALLSKSVRAALEALLEDLLEREGSASAVALLEVVGGPARRDRAAALRAALRYLFLFPHLDPADPRLIVGLLPGVHEGIRRVPTARLQRVVAAEANLQAVPAFGVADMTTVLLEASTGTLRLKSDGFMLYARSTQRLKDALTPLPGGLADALDADPHRRLDAALQTLGSMGFLLREQDDEGRLHLATESDSRDWLSLPEHERLRTLADRVRGEDLEEKATRGRHGPTPVSRLSPRLAARIAYAYDLDGTKLIAELRSALLTLPFQEEGAVPLGDWLEHHTRDRNPLTGRGPAGHALSPKRGMYGYVSPETLERIWSQGLFSAVADRLAPCGGIAVGMAPNGAVGADRARGPLVALTPVARYLLGATDELPAPAVAPSGTRVVVQPNFDVVFLGPAPGIEVSLAPLARRVGHGFGTVFRLERAAAMKAAAAGITAAEAVARLEDAQGGPIPENVRRSLEDWFGRVRHARSLRVLLVRAPDEESAGRIAAAGGKHAERVAPTLVAFHDKAAWSRARKRLAAEGVFVAPPERQGGPRGRRGR